MLRSHHRHRVGIKRQDRPRQATERGSPFRQIGENCLMAQMDAVEIANGHRRPGTGWLRPLSRIAFQHPHGKTTSGRDLTPSDE